MTLDKSLTLSESQFCHLQREDTNSHLPGLVSDFKIIYVKCLCFIERAIVIARNGVGIGLYLGTAEERKRAEGAVGTFLIHSSRNSSGFAACWPMLGSQRGLSLSLSARGSGLEGTGWGAGRLGRDGVEGNRYRALQPQRGVLGEARGAGRPDSGSRRPRVNVC